MIKLTPEQLKLYKLKKAQKVLEEEKIDTKAVKAKAEQYVNLDKNKR